MKDLTELEESRALIQAKIVRLVKIVNDLTDQIMKRNEELQELYVDK